MMTDKTRAQKNFAIMESVFSAMLLKTKCGIGEIDRVGETELSE